MSREVDADILGMDGEDMVDEIMRLRAEAAALRQQLDEHWMAQENLKLLKRVAELEQINKLLNARPARPKNEAV